MFEGNNMSYGQYYETIAKVYARIKPISGLTFDFSFTPQIGTTLSKGTTKGTTLYDYKTGALIYKSTGLPTISESRDYSNNKDLNLLVTYDKGFKKHHVTAIGGYQLLTNDFNQLSGYRQGNNFPQFMEINAFDPTGQSTGGYSNQFALMSYFGRLNYNFDSKYFLEANVRNDGSSRFAEGYKWGVFPSFSAAWRFTSEKFMKKWIG